MNLQSIKRHWQLIAIVTLAIALVASLVWAVSENKRATERNNSQAPDRSTQDVREQLEEHGITPLAPPQASNSEATAKAVAYLIEEEKLAHDVYQALYDKWGARLFTNIKNSETSHQNMVLAVMESRGLSDPRTGEFGTFTNQDLQKLYDSLIARGNQSQAEAYKVGVIIEETDIADLKNALSTLDPKDVDVKDVLEKLLSGSENHLRAFNRQVSR